MHDPAKVDVLHAPHNLQVALTVFCAQLERHLTIPDAKIAAYGEEVPFTVYL